MKKHMRNLAVALLVLSGTFFVGASDASAASITSNIGTFSWDQFFGESITLTNDSAAPGLAGNFTDIVLLLTLEDATLGPVESFFPSTLSAETPDNSFNVGYDGPFSAVRLQFRYAATNLPELIFDQTFLRADEGLFAFIDYTYDVADPDPNPNPNPVPEPSTLVLLALGTGGLMAKRQAGRTS